jgi:hypothetical protein
MRADRVEASWDPGKKKWLVRIQLGEEVVRRFCDAPKDAQEPVIITAAKKMLTDEGYEPEVAQMTIHH